MYNSVGRGKVFVLFVKESGSSRMNLQFTIQSKAGLLCLRLEDHG